MAGTIVNILATTFSGLDLPRTLTFPVPRSTSIENLRSDLVSRLPLLDIRFLVTTNSGKELHPTSLDPLSTLLSSDEVDFLPLRITVPLRGGKGGFGSQLRAAGGRMASRKKKNQGENNGSSRNLDGRRLRTATEAKALAEYLAVKPEMEKREKETRRMRWQELVETAERREQEIRHGRKGKLDGKWVEEKEEASERIRDAVAKAVRIGDHGSIQRGSIEEARASVMERDNLVDEASEPSQGDADETLSLDVDRRLPLTNPSAGLRCFGFEENDFISSEDEGDEGNKHSLP